MYFLEFFEKGVGYLAYDVMAAGLIKILIMIAILQLVKKIPDIINTIFGTQIKDRGGIKGRLGEMAAVGGLAQKAWTSLGTTAKNIGKLVAAAPIAGAAFGANALYRKKTGRNLTETDGVRKIRAIGSAVGTGLKTGNVIKSVDAYNTAYDNVKVSPLDKIKRTANTNAEIDKIMTKRDTDGTEGNVSNLTNVVLKSAAQTELEKRIQTIGGKDVDKTNKTYQQKVKAASFAQSISKNFAAVLEENEKAAHRLELANDIEGAKRIRKASEKFKANGFGNHNLEAMVDFISNNQELYDPTVVGNLIGENGKLTSMDRQYKYVTVGNRFELSGKDLADLGRGAAAIDFLANNTLKGKVESAKADLDVAIASARLTETDKMELEKFISADTDIGNSYAFAVGRKDSESRRTSGVTGMSDQAIRAAATQAQQQAAQQQAAQQQAAQAQQQAAQAQQQAQNQSELAQIINEMSALNDENSTIRDEYISLLAQNQSDAVRQRRDEIRQRQTEIEGRLRVLQTRKTELENILNS